MYIFVRHFKEMTNHDGIVEKKKTQKNLTHKKNDPTVSRIEQRYNYGHRRDLTQLKPINLSTQQLNNLSTQQLKNSTTQTQRMSVSVSLGVHLLGHVGHLKRTS